MSTTSAPPRRPSLAQILLNLVRGALIGMAELVPGISGGTVALITGVYERLLDAVAHVFAALKRLVRGPDRLAGFRAEAQRTDWWLIAPVIAGMAAVVLMLAGVIEHLVTADPIAARGLFFGLVAASLVVPLQMARRAARADAVRARHRATDLLLFLATGTAAFALIGFADGGTVADPPLVLVFLAATVAICALVVPGVSGSFFLLAVGLYAPTLQAVSERDLVYIAVFAAGALVGLVTIVRGMRMLLTRHRRATLFAITGLLVGSLRALWPWQRSASGETDGVGTLLPPSGEVLAPVLLALLGAAVVTALIVVEHRVQARSVTASEVAPRDTVKA